MPVLAQANDGDIIVTARRIEERLQDVPISMTVFNQQTLTNRNVVNAADIALYTPSLSSNGRFGAENTSFSIRGFVQDQGTAPSVAVYFDDVATLRAFGGTTFGNGAGPGSFFDLSNVQVLKGTQGTLFGRNTTGGAVLLVPQKPTGRLEGYVEGSYGNFSMKRVQAVLNVPVSDSFRVRVGVDHNQRDGYLHNYSNIGPRDFADTNYTAVRGSAVADLTPNLENYLTITYSDSDTHGYLPQVFDCLPALYPVNSSSYNTAVAGCAQINRQNARGDYYGVENAAVAPRLHITQWQIINKTAWRASDTLTVRNIASYGEFREDFRASPYGENLIIPDGPNAGLSLRKAGVNPTPGLHNAAESTFTDEFRLEGNSSDNRLTWQTGGYIELSEPIGFSGTSSVSTGVCLTPNDFQCFTNRSTLGGTGGVNERLNKQDAQDYGLFGQATYKLTDKLSATGGIRYTWDKTKAVTGQTFYLIGPTATSPVTALCQLPANPAGCFATFVEKSSAPTWLIDLDYKPTEDMLLYAKYSRGYRAGGAKVDGGPSFVIFDPEKVDSYEVGLKSTFRGAVKGTFNVSAFYSKFLAQQLAARLDPTAANLNPTPPSVIASNARSRIYGVEVEGSIQPFRGLNIDGSYAYLNSKLLSIPPVSGSSLLFFPPTTTGSTPGYPLGYAPKNKFTITGTYTLPLDASVGKVSVGATFSHSDSELTSASYVIPVSVSNPTIPANLVGNLGNIPGVNLVNVNLTWANVAGKPIDIGLFATNLLKEKYAAAVFGGISAFGFDARALGEPRMYGVRVKGRFGQ